MDKSLSFVIQPIIIISVVALILFKGLSHQTESVMGVDTSNFAEVFTVFIEEGDVFYKDAKSSDFVKIKTEEIHLPNKTVIKTDDGLAHVILPDNSTISLDKFTTIEVNVDAEATNIKQLYGATWHRIKELSKVGEYNVETDNTLAAVRGTVFGVNVNENLETDVFVVESKVDVSKFQRKDNHKEILDTKKLTTNRWVKVKNDNVRSMTVSTIPDEIKQNRWFAKNMELNNTMQGITQKNMRKVFTQIKQTRENPDTLGVQDENTNDESDQTQASTNTQQNPNPQSNNPIIKKITKLKRKIVDNDSNSNDNSSNNGNTNSGGGNTEVCKAGTLFQIGDVEDSQLDNPADEFNWNGQLGIFPDYAKVFIANGENQTNTKLFPWNSNYSVKFNNGDTGYATDFNVVFDVPEGHQDSLFKLTYSWTPGRSGSEQKEVFIDGKSLHKTPTRQGKSVDDWWFNMERFIEPNNSGNQNQFRLSEGTHTLNFKHLKGDGTVWDWIRVDILEANCVEKEELIKTGTLFMIGEENSKDENPSAEFNFEEDPNPDLLGKFLDFSDPFVVGENSDKDFPWNSNASRKLDNGRIGYATDFDVKFKVEGAGLAEGILFMSWLPGQSGVETKEVYLDDNLIATLKLEGAKDSSYWKSFKRYPPAQIPIAFFAGEHTLTFKHTTGDGTFWDWVKLEIKDVKPISE